MIVATINLDVAQAEAALKAYPRLLPQAAAKALRVYLMRVARYAMAAKFSGPGTPSNTLKVQTGLARSSVGQSPQMYVSSSGVVGVWGAEPEYVRRHEEGGTFTESVRAHTRRLRSSSGGNAFEFTEHYVDRKTGEDRFRVKSAKSKVVERVRTVQVRAHTRTKTYRARHMIGDSMKRTRPLLDAYVARAVASLLKTGKAPTIGDITRG